jgi:hypothetical protein
MSGKAMVDYKAKAKAKRQVRATLRAPQKGRNPGRLRGGQRSQFFSLGASQSLNLDPPRVTLDSWAGRKCAVQSDPISTHAQARGMQKPETRLDRERQHKALYICYRKEKMVRWESWISKGQALQATPRCQARRGSGVILLGTVKWPEN